MPNPKTFPITGLTMSVQMPDSTTSEVTLPADAVATSLQYSPSYGLPKLVQWLRDWQLSQHAPPPLVDADGKAEQLGICVFNGSQQALGVAFDLLLNEGDPVFVEDPTYSGGLAALRPIGARPLPVRIDEHGLIPQELERQVKANPSSRVLYSIPTGQNPSGVSMTPERKRQVYEIASRHNLLIIEDDPYWNLQLDDSLRKDNVSFLSLDRDGRVLRLDSFSKVISAGLRVGFASGPAALVEKMQLHQQCTTLHPSGISQQLLLAILTQWGPEGLQAHIERVRRFYTAQRDSLFTAVQTHLGDLVDYDLPKAGMFAWLRCKGIEDTDVLLKTHATAAKVLALSGRAFSPEQLPSSYLRLAYSTATAEEMDTACQRLRTMLLSGR